MFESCWGGALRGESPAAGVGAYLRAAMTVLKDRHTPCVARLFRPRAQYAAQIAPQGARPPAVENL